MNYFLVLIAAIALIKSLGSKAWTMSLISIGLLISPVLLLLDYLGLFYHSIGLCLISLLAFLLLVVLDKKNESTRSFWLMTAVVIPYVFVVGFKLFQLQGIPVLRWTLIIGLISFIYLSIDRRKFDAAWFILLFIACSSALILTY